ncbi:MAG: DUF1573 domain-containing protein [Crocinitomicaceae bacterium]|nr:DUF1573 domain-containing protein [Crocinitomicaceae bacterium]
MSRLYLIIVFSCSVFSFSWGQNLLSKYLKVADEKYQKGDYYYALELYSKAMDIDSNTIDILWKVAEAHRAYKDYRKAEYYYAKVYEREMGKIYPSSLLQLGLMQKQNGKYDAAIETFKKAKKKYKDNRKDYVYLKAKQELESTLWAKSMVDIVEKGDFVRLPETINTKNSEFGHNFIKNELVFSSLRADSISANEEVYEKHYTTNIYHSKFDDGRFEQSERWQELNSLSGNTGNAALSLDGTRLYFSSCKDVNGVSYQCKIAVAKYINDKWTAIDTLGDIINAPGANTTMPAIGELDGKEVLFFCSDRQKETKGGLDIFYSTITNGNQFSKVKSIKNLNSIDNEVTPFWDRENQRLYYASSWFYGFGGIDVFYSDYKNGQFQEPQNAGQPINSPANDLYYFNRNDTSYVTSNRIGVLYSKNSTCCSDIFAHYPVIEEPPASPRETLEELSKRLPVTLYFHNDIPDPRSWDTVTKLSYMTTYNEYTEMLPRYQKEYAVGLSGEKVEEAKEDIEDFFTEFVDQGVKDLFLFRDLLLEELQKGARIKIVVRGFASPLAKTEYNVNLTKRRISSLINHLREFNGGIFIPYLDGTASNNGRVVFEQVPFGEYNANQLISDNPNDTKNSVYSRAAAAERKIEIQSVTYLDEQEVFPLTLKSPVFNAGVLPSGQTITAVFEVVNSSEKEIEILPNITPNNYTTVQVEKTTLQPHEQTQITVELKTDGFVGHNVKTIYVPLKDVTENLRLILTMELK